MHLRNNLSSSPSDDHLLYSKECKAASPKERRNPDHDSSSGDDDDTSHPNTTVRGRRGEGKHHLRPFWTQDITDSGRPYRILGTDRTPLLSEQRALIWQRTQDSFI